MDEVLYGDHFGEAGLREAVRREGALRRRAECTFCCRGGRGTLNGFRCLLSLYGLTASLCCTNI